MIQRYTAVITDNSNSTYGKAEMVLYTDHLATVREAEERGRRDGVMAAFDHVCQYRCACSETDTCCEDAALSTLPPLGENGESREHLPTAPEGVE